jgi:hypothetical protein
MTATAQVGNSQITGLKKGLPSETRDRKRKRKKEKGKNNQSNRWVLGKQRR